jgi:hypothetical protein
LSLLQANANAALTDYEVALKFAQGIDDFDAQKRIHGMIDRIGQKS